MDPITTALVSAISSGFNNQTAEAGQSVYQAVKKAVQTKIGNTQAIEALEADQAST